MYYLKLLYYLALFVGLNSFSQNLNDIEIYNTENSDIIFNQINSIEFDNQNRLWAGTANGLSIFDLSTNTWYNFDEPNSTLTWCCESSVNINTIHWAEAINKMYIGTNNGIISFDNSNNDINYDDTNWTTNIGLDCSANSSIINAILYDNGIWSGSTDGLCIEYFGGEGEWLLQNTQTGFYSNHYKSINQNPNTNLIAIGTMNGGLITYDGEFNNYYSSNSGILDNSVFDAVFDQNNNIIITTPQAGLGILTESGSWIWLNTLNSNIPTNSLKNITVDVNNNLWITTLENGLTHYKNNLFYNYNTSNSNLPDNQINCLSFDQDNNLWIGTNSSGLIKINNPTLDTPSFTKPFDNIKISASWDLIEVNLHEKGQYEILNQNGQLINTGFFNPGDNKVNTAAFASGLYIFKIKTNESAFVYKILKD